MRLKHLLSVALIALIGGGNAWADWTDITNGDALEFTTKIGFGDPRVQKTSVFEIWTDNAEAAFDLNQTVSEVPAGIYELSANAMYRASLTYGTATNCVLYANIGEKTFSTPIKNYGDGTTREDHLAVANAMVNHKAYGNKVTYIVVEENATNATIGMKSNGALPFCTNGYWLIYNKASFSFKNVTNDVFAKMKSQAEGLVASAQEGDAKTALQAVVSTCTEANVANVQALKEAVTNYLWAAASEDSPIDVTSNIENPSFEGGQVTFWYQDFGYKQPNPATNMAQPNGWDLLYSGPKVNNSANQSFTTQETGAKDGNCLYVRHRWGDVLAVEDLRQSIHNLPAGKYRLTVAVKGGSSVTDANTLTLTAGANTNTTTIADFDKSNYKDYSVEVIKTDEESTLDLCYGLKQTSGVEQLYYIDDFRLYFLGKTTFATPEDYEALNNAITAAEAKTLGFQKDEYAPYNNVAVIAALKAAKAIDQTAQNAQEIVVAATEALAEDQWTANTEEVNAVYDGTFANAVNDGAPAGWTMSDNTLGGALHSRAFVGDNRLEEFNDTKSGFFIRFDGSNSSRGSWYHYGKTEGYTMPLAANTKYCVTVDAKNWGDKTGKPLKLSVTGPEGFTSVDTQINTTHDADKDNEAPQKMTLNFTTAEAGNYVINFSCPGDGNEHMCLISNIVLMTSKEVSADMTISSVGTATFCAPFDVEIPEGVTAYEAKIADNSWVKLEDAKLVEGKLPAGTPVVLKGEAMQKTFTDVPTVTVTKSSCLVGNLGTEKVEVVANAGNYLLQKNDGVLAWYQVKNTGLYIGVNRCYLEFSGDNAREFFPMDFDNPTGIDSIATEAKTKADGKYLVNGKIVVVKAGKVYEVK